MGNHSIDCVVCGNDLRGLSGGCAPYCPGDGASSLAIEQFKSIGRRPNGYYFVKVSEGRTKWHIAYWCLYYWEFAGNPGKFADDCFSEIGACVPLPDES